MPMLEDIADGLARRTMDLIKRTGDDMLDAKVADTLGASSPTLEEAFSTAMRIRKAEVRGQRLLDSIEGDLADEAPIELPPPAS